jgi:hypothetical protein
MWMLVGRVGISVFLAIHLEFWPLLFFVNKPGLVGFVLSIASFSSMTTAAAVVWSRQYGQSV